jgi:G3E family GTPase
VTLLTGFLGSSKTTVLNHLVRQPGLARTLVIINEPSEVGLDHLLVSRIADDTLIEMSSGCLSCTVRGDVVATLKDVTWCFTRGGERQFDRVIIETTGLTDPAPIIHTLTTVGVLARRYRLDGIVTPLDMTCCRWTLDGHLEALDPGRCTTLILAMSTFAEPLNFARERFANRSQTASCSTSIRCSSATCARRR